MNISVVLVLVGISLAYGWQQPSPKVFYQTKLEPVQQDQTQQDPEQPPVLKADPEITLADVDNKDNTHAVEGARNARFLFGPWRQPWYSYDYYPRYYYTYNRPWNYHWENHWW